jgi:AbrB family looped-hinge helix DNA binding protein
MKATVSARGRVTIPKPLRIRLGLNPGSVIEFEAQGGTLVGRMAVPQDPVDEAWGILKMDTTVDEFIDASRRH